MNFLFIDTTCSYITISIGVNNKITFFYHEYVEKDIASKVLPIIKDGIKQSNITLNDLNKIFIVNGPGSFTGIRVGVTVAKTIAWALNKTIIPISSLELMATTNTEKKYIVPMIDARRGNVFSGIYDKNLKVIKKDSLINLNELKEKLNDDYELVSYDEITGSVNPKIDILKIIYKHLNDNGVNPHSLNPNYLKLTEAEEKMERKD